MTELAGESPIAGATLRFEKGKEANKLRKMREFAKALPLYRELSADNSDSYSAAGLLQCLRDLRLFDEALALCSPANPNHLALNWYRNEVVWVLIQGRLQKLDESARLTEVVKEAESILALKPNGIVAKWIIVRRVLKAAKAKSRWDTVLEWVEKVNPDELSVSPLQDDHGRTGWCERAIWHNCQIRAEIEVGDKEKAIIAAQRAKELFPRQAKYFIRLEGLANFRLGRLIEAELLYSKLSSGERSDGWILTEYAHVLQELDKSREALMLMCKAAFLNKKIELLVSVFSDIGFLCHKLVLKQEARNHLALCKYIREEQGWKIPQDIHSLLSALDSELVNSKVGANRDRILAECQSFWRKTAGGEEKANRKIPQTLPLKKMLKGRLRMGAPQRPYCFLVADDRESYFCSKSDLPKEAIDGVFLQFDAIPSFDKKKRQESWKAVNVRTI